MLDDAIDNDGLAQWYPTLETGIGVIDKSGLHRLTRSLESGRAPIHIYRALQAGGVTHGLTGSDFNNLLLRYCQRGERRQPAIAVSGCWSPRRRCIRHSPSCRQEYPRNLTAMSNLRLPLASQAAKQPRVSPLRSVIADRDAQSLLLPDQDEQSLAPRDPRVGGALSTWGWLRILRGVRPNWNEQVPRQSIPGGVETTWALP
jgi:hypothetical protein